MNLADRAIRGRDQTVLNRVAAACVSVAIEMGGRKASKVLADSGANAAQKLTPILLATVDDSWLEDDGALLAGVRAVWGRL